MNRLHSHPPSGLHGLSDYRQCAVVAAMTHPAEAIAGAPREALSATGNYMGADMGATAWA